MHRLATILVLVFAFAAVAGMTTAHAHRYVSTPIVVLNHVDADNQPIPVIVEVQRGEIDLGQGIMLPCGSHHAIVALVPKLSARRARSESITAADDTARPWIVLQMLRPPIAA